MRAEGKRGEVLEGWGGRGVCWLVGWWAGRGGGGIGSGGGASAKGGGEGRFVRMGKRAGGGFYGEVYFSRDMLIRRVVNGGRGVVEFCWEKADVALRARVGICVFIHIVGVGFS